MFADKDALYDLLPAYIRLRDAQTGIRFPDEQTGVERQEGALQELMAIIGAQARLIERDFVRMYDNWFIETCDDWVVPYIGDLLGYDMLPGPAGDRGTVSGRRLAQVVAPRREVANLIAHRRRKGTLWLLEELAQDVANWPARAVEFYRLLAVSQHLDHRQLTRTATVDVRDATRLELLDTPFDTSGHLADMRRISSEESPGHHNIPNVGLFVFRIKPYTVTKTSAYCREDEGLHCYTFSVLGNDTPLYRLPEPERDATSLADEANLPVPIRRRALEGKPIDGYNLRLLSVDAADGLPNEGRNLVIVALVGTHLQMRIFDANGKRVVDKAENELISGKTLTALKKQLNPLPDESRLSQEQKQKIIRDATSIAGSMLFDAKPSAYITATETLYGEGKSLAVYAPNWPRRDSVQPIPANSVIPADLSDWSYKIPKNKIAVDPKLGRIVFPKSQVPRNGVLVSYRYGFVHEIGGGEYESPLPALPDKVTRYYVDPGLKKPEAPWFDSIDAAFQDWRALPESKLGLKDSEKTRERALVIELKVSGIYKGRIGFALNAGEAVWLVAANRTRPVIWLSDKSAGGSDSISIRGGSGSRVVIDGVLIAGRGVDISGATDIEEPSGSSSDGEPEKTGDLCEVVFRHTTLVPGWTLHCDCEPRRPAEASILLENTTARVVIDSSIVGAIQVNSDGAVREPTRIVVCDSIIDATSHERTAIGSGTSGIAYADVTIARSTIVGSVLAHILRLAENSIFTGHVRVARRQKGCVRFSFVPHDSRTPRRHHCQPDGVLAGVPSEVEKKLEAVHRPVTVAERDAMRERLTAEALIRVAPYFDSLRYGTPAYLRLSECVTDEIKRGADDESEMGVCHDLFEPQRLALLTKRLDEYVPASTVAAVLFAS